MKTTTSETQHRLAGEMLFLEGDMPQGVYVLHSGEIELLFDAGTRAKNHALRITTAGQIIGLDSIVGHRRHDCSAICRTKCELTFIDGEAFLRSLDDDPAAWLAVLRQLSGNVNAVYEDLRLVAAG